MTNPPPATSTPSDPDYTEAARPSASRDDAATLADALQHWLATRLGPAAQTVVTDVSFPAAAGMSSDTVMFRACWRDNEGPVTRRLVARLAPSSEAMPVFPHYDIGLQAAVMQAVSDHSSVPVPLVYWYERSPDALGREFLVMERVDGDIPPDVMPYNFESWLLDAHPDERRRLQDSSVDLLVALHGIDDPWVVCPGLADAPGPMTADAALRAHVAAQRRYYEWAIADGPRSPLIERAFDHLESDFPAVDGPAVLCWGDARIGNVVYRDFRPAAVLDWEMATLGPGELDLGWMIFLHRFFEDIAAQAGMPGLPEMLRRKDVSRYYSTCSGKAVRDLDWFITYAALRQAVIMFRIQCRTIAFGQATAPSDPDDMIMHRAGLERMISGTYWTDLDEKGR
ncbi:MAG: phosphotransferase family protein [Tomitella sp.]|nr:phosphotransferase family protein [Tomitella sp.]